MYNLTLGLMEVCINWPKHSGLRKKRCMVPRPFRRTMGRARRASCKCCSSSSVGVIEGLEFLTFQVVLHHYKKVAS